MNKKPVDKTKKTNIKCEHCKYWDKVNYIDDRSKCKCIKEGNVKTETYYWNRCKNFEWNTKYQ